jgi:uncharacterized protein (DUF2164 family)
MKQKLWYCQVTDTIRTAENMLLLFRNKSIWSNTWLLTFDRGVDDVLVHLTYKYLQQATGFTVDGQVMVEGLNKYITESTYSEKTTLIDTHRSGRTTRIVDLTIQELFKGKTVTILDHHMDGKDRKANQNLTKRILNRLSVEHGIEVENTTLETKEDFVRIRLKY